MSGLLDFRVLTFDCYGTLIDWETGIWEALQPLVEANPDADVMRTDALGAFSRLESAHQAGRPSDLYPAILRAVHADLAAVFSLETAPELDEQFGRSVGNWPAFPDSADALQRLSATYRLVILSNVDRSSFAESAARLGVDFDAVYTAEDIGSYKPSPANFEYLLEHLAADFGLGRGDILHTAQSLFHDHVRAAEFGLATAWIDRQRLSDGGDWGATAEVPDRPDPDFLFFSMGEMADAVDTARDRPGA